MFNNKKKSIAAVILAAVLLAGCGEGGKTSDSRGDDKKPITSHSSSSESSSSGEVTSGASSKKKTAGDYEYIDKGNCIAISHYKGSADYVTIPEVIDGKPVEIIGAEAFRGCSEVKTVSFPKTVKTIEPMAFYGCRCLERVDVSDGTAEIGERAFANCQALKTVIIPQSVSKIGDELFEDCDSVIISYGDKIFISDERADFYALFLDKYITFTDEEISIIRGCFEDGLYGGHLVHPDPPFDFSRNNKISLDSVLKVFDLHNHFCQHKSDEMINRYIEKGYAEFYFKPETVEELVKEYLIPDFRLSDYNLGSSTNWDSEKNMFRFTDADTIGANTYDILDEYSKDGLYYITVLSYNESSDFDFGKITKEDYLCFDRQYYVFRKLPNGHIAPYMMDVSGPLEWEEGYAEVKRKFDAVKTVMDTEFAPHVLWPFVLYLRRR